MRGIIKSLAALGSLFIGASIVGPGQVRAGDHDGHWSVLIITEKGDCDRAYRYPVTVANGQVRYAGEAGISVGGTVAANGLVRVSIRRGEQGANGSGHLVGLSGSGIWQGVGSNGACAGRWEAERR